MGISAPRGTGSSVVVSGSSVATSTSSPSMAGRWCSSRSDTRHGHPAETVGPVKQRRIIDLANAYIRRHRLQDCQVRIDVVTVTFGAAGDEPIVEHFQNAFDGV